MAVKLSPSTTAHASEDNFALTALNYNNDFSEQSLNTGAWLLTQSHIYTSTLTCSNNIPELLPPTTFRVYPDG